jgi:hypothetical protein
MTAWPPSLLAGVLVLGVAVGFVAGTFGVGGGFLLTPMLVALYGVPLPIAVGTSLCQIIATATASLLRHQKLGQGELRFDLLLLPGSLVGVEVGARLLEALQRQGELTLLGHRAPLANVALESLYAFALLGIALLYWRRTRDETPTGGIVRPGPLARLRLPPYVRLPAVPLESVPALVVVALGLGMGLLSGLLGIGGGVALMPVMLYGFGFPFRQAAGTGVLVLLATACVGTVSHALRGNVDLPLALLLMVGSTLSAQAGALSAKRWSPRTLTRLNATVTLAAVAALAWDLARRFGV